MLEGNTINEMIKTTLEMKRDSGDSRYSAPSSGCPEEAIFELPGGRITHIIAFIHGYLSGYCS